MKKIFFIVFLLIFGVTLVADSVYDRTVTVLDKTRDQEVQETFRTLIAAYTDEDARSFFDVVSEDRFEQDYITFSDAVYNDFRLYDIMQVDFWFEGIIPVNQVGRIVTVRWEERYESLESSEQFETRGLSRFTFDEIDGEFYLIRIEGNNLFGISSVEWNEEVPPIAGQEAKPSGGGLAADIKPNNYQCTYTSPSDTVVFDIQNISNITASGSVTYTIKKVPHQSDPGPFDATDTITVNLQANSSTQQINSGLTCSCNDMITVTLTSSFPDSDSSNNSVTFNADPGGCP
jgi:hypothetical protein